MQSYLYYVLYGIVYTIILYAVIPYCPKIVFFILFVFRLFHSTLFLYFFLFLLYNFMQIKLGNDVVFTPKYNTNTFPIIFRQEYQCTKDMLLYNLRIRLMQEMHAMEKTGRQFSVKPQVSFEYPIFYHYTYITTINKSLNQTLS